MAKAFAPKILTANHLLGGHSVYLDARGHWAANHHTAKVVHRAEDQDAVLAIGKASEASNEVVGVYWVDVDVSGGLPEPTHYREKMRVRARPSFWQDNTGADRTAA